MNPKEAIQKIKALFEMLPEDKPAEEVKIDMAEYSLKDGSKVMISELMVGADVTDINNEPVPDGEYELSDGQKFVVVGGKIESMEPSAEEEPSVEVEVEAEEEDKDKKLEDMKKQFEDKIAEVVEEKKMLEDKVKELEMKQKQGFAKIVELIEVVAKIPQDDPMEKPQSFKYAETKDIKLERLNKYRNAILNNKN